jgi:hypothetical protein
LHWYQVRDGDTILVHLSKARTYSRPIPTRNFFSKFSKLMEATTFAEIEAGEAARITDRDYTNSEVLRTFPQFIAAVLSSRHDAASTDLQMEHTVIAPSAGISDSPLPTIPPTRPRGRFEACG